MLLLQRNSKLIAVVLSWFEHYLIVVLREMSVIVAVHMAGTSGLLIPWFTFLLDTSPSPVHVYIFLLPGGIEVKHWPSGQRPWVLYLLDVVQIFPFGRPLVFPIMLQCCERENMCLHSTTINWILCHCFKLFFQLSSLSWSCVNVGEMGLSIDCSQ